MNEKIILDACCGSKKFWFNKKHPLAIYVDIRKENHVLCDNRMLEINPDMIADFRNLPFKDDSFKLVVFDPPHFNDVGETSYMCLSYGSLPKDWKPTIRKGFEECLRVLQSYGILIFKWNETQIKVRDILEVIGIQPLFGHKSGKKSNTHWLVFMKI